VVHAVADRGHSLRLNIATHRDTSCRRKLETEKKTIVQHTELVMASTFHTVGRFGSAEFDKPSARRGGLLHLATRLCRGFL